MRRVIVCGSRSWHDRAIIKDRLARLVLDDFPGERIIIVHGDAEGADRIAADEAGKAGLYVEAHPYRPFLSPTVGPKRAPLVRNAHMAELGADLCIAFWDGQSTGTQHMVEQARRRGIRVDEVIA